MMITILHISEQRKGKGAPCGSTANGLLFLAVFYLGGPIQFGPLIGKCHTLYYINIQWIEDKCGNSSEEAVKVVCD